MGTSKIIKSGLYLDRIQPDISKNVNKVLLGYRRSGKSYLLLNIIEMITATDPKANIIFINKDY